MKGGGHATLLHTSEVYDSTQCVQGLQLSKWGGAVPLYPARVHMGACPRAERSLPFVWALYPEMEPALYLSIPGWRAPLVSPHVDGPYRAAGWVSAHH